LASRLRPRGPAGLNRPPTKDQAENSFRPRRLEISNLKQQITNNFPMNECPEWPKRFEPAVFFHLIIGRSDLFGP
jgi:hypothetical protein